jgi:transcriptional regulator with XRE-family HTH domain
VETIEERRKMYILMHGDNVRALREEMLWSQQELATAAGISPVTARSAERGGRVQATTAKRIAQAVGVDPPQALGRVARRA